MAQVLANIVFPFFKSKKRIFFPPEKNVADVVRNEKDLVEIKKNTVGPPPLKRYMQVERGRVCVLRVVLHYRQKNNQNNDGLKKKVGQTRYEIFTGGRSPLFKRECIRVV